MSGDPTTLRRLYGRRQGHKLRGVPAGLVETLLPQVEVPPTGAVDAPTLFGDNRPLWLEIGFGKGEHLAELAAAHPEIGFIGCEPFLNGVAGALHEINARGLTNVRLHMGDALEVLERIAEGGLARVFLLHPDPWPKPRHAKRRFVNPGPLDVIAAKLMPGGEFRLGTDHPVYCRWALMQMARRTDFDWLVADAADWQLRPTDWPDSRYAVKARAQGHEIWYFRYRRAA